MNKQKLTQYRNWIVYQIYPKSFADSYGDGIGDLQGIIGKLDYIQALGANAIWICPCYPSSGADNGYDVENYTEIAPEYGTMADMEDLLSAAHKRGMKVLLDLVANHTSTRHKWFLESRKSRVGPYADFYYWADQPPNNWRSVFSKESAWIFDEERKQYYLASFTPTQADLNWTNAAVRQAMCSVVDFWTKKGVDGFRCDVLDMISKSFSLQNGNGNGPRLHEYIRQLFNRPSAKRLFTVGECWRANLNTFSLFCGTERGELSTTFQNDHRNFGFDKNDPYRPTPYRLADVANALSVWQRQTIDGDLLYSLFWENHDSPRIINRFGAPTRPYESGTMLSTMLYLLCGTAFIYQGQELGLTNSNFQRLTDFDDVEAKNYYHAHVAALGEQEVFRRINAFGRDNGRRMMPWTEKPSRAWIAHIPEHFRHSVQAQLTDENSYLRYFKKLLALRNRISAFRHGDFCNVSVDENAFVYKRTYEGETYTVVCNFEKENEIHGLHGEILLSNLHRPCPSGKYQPYECAVLHAK